MRFLARNAGPFPRSSPSCSPRCLPLFLSAETLKRALFFALFFLEDSPHLSTCMSIKFSILSSLSSLSLVPLPPPLQSSLCALSLRWFSQRIAMRSFPLHFLHLFLDHLFSMCLNPVLPESPRAAFVPFVPQMSHLSPRPRSPLVLLTGKVHRQEKVADVQRRAAQPARPADRRREQLAARPRPRRRATRMCFVKETMHGPRS